MPNIVPFTMENINKCLCVKCPVQEKSHCVKEKMAKAEEMKKLKSKMMPSATEVPGLYCSSGRTSCKDTNTKKMCICGDCPVWKEHALNGGNPKGYFCRDGQAV